MSYDETAPRTCTRQFCSRCRDICRIDFASPIWKQVAGPYWSNERLCLTCFATIGDEKSIAWEEGIEFFPQSFVTHLILTQGDTP